MNSLGAQAGIVSAALLISGPLWAIATGDDGIGFAVALTGVALASLSIVVDIWAGRHRN